VFTPPFLPGEEWATGGLRGSAEERERGGLWKEGGYAMGDEKDGRLRGQVRSGASLQKLHNSEILSYLEIGRHLGVLILQKEVS
jgi:hypothetical protein